MKPTSPELLALLASRQFYAADLWTITLIGGGTVLRYTSGDADISANGFAFSAGGQIGPYFDRTDNKAKCSWGVGTDVDTLSVDIIPGAATVLGGAFLTACRQGVFDGADVRLDRAFMPTYGDTSRGVVPYFQGRVAEIDLGRSLSTWTINSYTELLNLQFPRNLAMSSCMNNLGDTACTVNLNSFKSTGTCGAGATTSQITATLGGSFGAGTFDFGTMTFTSGALNGYTATIRQAGLSGTTATIKLMGFLPSAPANGDTFNIFYGCNKDPTDSNGCPKFSNIVHFRGFPFIPQPVLAV